MNRFIIRDWANNILDFKGRFDLECFAVPMQFNSFDDAWEYALEHFSEDSLDDIEVIHES